MEPLVLTTQLCNVSLAFISVNGTKTYLSLSK